MTRAPFAVACLVCGFVAAAAQPAAAQPARAFIHVSGGQQTTSTAVSSTVTTTINLESSPATTTFTIKPGVVADVMGGVRFGRVFAVGVGYTQFSQTADGDVSARIPHPFFSNQPRTIAGTVSGLKRKETAVHVEIGAFAETGPLQIAIFGGPSWFQLEQDLVSSVSYTESYPYDTAAFGSASVQKASSSKLGFHVLFDVAYMFSRNAGAGFSVRYSKATIPLAAADGTTTSVTAGGTQIGAGLRLRF